MRLFFLTAAFLLISQQAFALMCEMMDPIKNYEIVFKGKAVSSQENPGIKSWGGQEMITTFEVIEKYKGDIEETIDIHHIPNHMGAGWSVKYELNKTYVIAVSKFKDKSQVNTEYFLAQPCASYHATDILSAEKYKAVTEAFLKAINYQPDNPELYYLQGQFHLENNDKAGGMKNFEKWLNQDYNGKMPGGELGKGIKTRLDRGEIPIVNNCWKFISGYIRALHNQGKEIETKNTIKNLPVELQKRINSELSEQEAKNK